MFLKPPNLERNKCAKARECSLCFLQKDKVAKQWDSETIVLFVIWEEVYVQYQPLPSSLDYLVSWKEKLEITDIWKCKKTSLNNDKHSLTIYGLKVYLWGEKTPVTIGQL